MVNYAYHKLHWGDGGRILTGGPRPPWPLLWTAPALDIQGHWRTDIEAEWSNNGDQQRRAVTSGERKWTSSAIHCHSVTSPWCHLPRHCCQASTLCRPPAVVHYNRIQEKTSHNSTNCVAIQGVSDSWEPPSPFPRIVYNNQWLKCNGTQGNAVAPPPIYGSKRSSTSDCYNARERHTTIVRDPNLNVAFPHL